MWGFCLLFLITLYVKCCPYKNYTLLGSSLILKLEEFFFLSFLIRRKYEVGMYVEASSKKEDEGVGLWLWDAAPVKKEDYRVKVQKKKEVFKTRLWNRCYQAARPQQDCLSVILCLKWLPPGEAGLPSRQLHSLGAQRWTCKSQKRGLGRGKSRGGKGMEIWALQSWVWEQAGAAHPGRPQGLWNILHTLKL